MAPRFLKLFLLVGLFSLVPLEAFAQKYTGSPVKKDRLLKAIRSKQFAVPILVKQIKISGVDFEMTPAAEAEFRAVKANPEVIAAASANYRYAGMRQAPVKPQVDTASNQYEDLIYQGLDALGELANGVSPAEVAEIAKELTGIGNRAVRLNAARPDGYRLVGSGNLLLRNFTEAERHFQNAIDRGGSVAFPVLHLAGNPHLEFVHIGKGFMTVESDQKFFQFNTGEASSPQAQQDYIAPNMRLATFSVATFKAGRSDIWYFAAMTTGMPQEVNMIMRLIRGNSM